MEKKHPAVGRCKEDTIRDKQWLQWPCGVDSTSLPYVNVNGRANADKASGKSVSEQNRRPRRQTVRPWLAVTRPQYTYVSHQQLQRLQYSRMDDACLSSPLGGAGEWASDRSQGRAFWVRRLHVYRTPAGRGRRLVRLIGSRWINLISGPLWPQHLNPWTRPRHRRLRPFPQTTRPRARSLCSCLERCCTVDGRS